MTVDDLLHLVEIVGYFDVLELGFFVKKLLFVIGDFEGFAFFDAGSAASLFGEGIGGVLKVCDDDVVVLIFGLHCRSLSILRPRRRRFKQTILLHRISPPKHLHFFLLLLPQSTHNHRPLLLQLYHFLLFFLNPQSVDRSMVTFLISTVCQIELHFDILRIGAFVA